MTHSHDHTHERPEFTAAEPDDPTAIGTSRRQLMKVGGVGATLAAASAVPGAAFAAEKHAANRGRHGGSRGRAWRSGDHHIHSEYSGEFDTSTNPPTFFKGADAVYPIVTNAIMAKNFGLSWAMCTDHGGPTHSKVNLEQAYPDLLRLAHLVPEVLQFWGMEFDAPAMDHHTLMIPAARGRGAAALRPRETLRQARRLPRRPGPGHRGEDGRVPQAAAKNMQRQAAGHRTPRRPLGARPRRLRARTRRASSATATTPPRTSTSASKARRATRPGPLNGGARGGYGNYPTHGGFDQMTARVGGLWDSLLGEGRQVVDHRHLGLARALDARRLRLLAGRVQQDLRERPPGLRRRHGRPAQRPHLRHHRRPDHRASTSPPQPRPTDRHCRRDPHRQPTGATTTSTSRSGSGRSTGKNANGDRPEVRRVDLIVGEITGPSRRPATPTPTPPPRSSPATEPATGAGKVSDYVIKHTLRNVEPTCYVRVRGTSTDEIEPPPTGSRAPWEDLWFYSNPVFVNVR